MAPIIRIGARLLSTKVSSHIANSNTFFRLDGRVALITGGGQSVGEGIAHRLASAGAKIAIFDQNSVTASAVARALGGAPHAIALPGNLTSAADIHNAIAETERKLGPIDILVNNAGIVGKTAPIWELTQDDFEQVLAINLIAPFVFSKTVLGIPPNNSNNKGGTGMFGRKYGRIINISSIAGKEGNPTLIPYSVSKAGLINLTKALSKEIAAKSQAGELDITVNAISPAVVRTKMLETMPQATIDYMIGKIPMGRTCKIEEVAALVHYLASKDASFCTGQCYDISGGRATY